MGAGVLPQDFLHVGFRGLSRSSLRAWTASPAHAPRAPSGAVPRAGRAGAAWAPCPARGARSWDLVDFRRSRAFPYELRDQHFNFCKKIKSKKPRGSFGREFYLHYFIYTDRMESARQFGEPCHLHGSTPSSAANRGQTRALRRKTARQTDRAVGPAAPRRWGPSREPRDLQTSLSQHRDCPGPAPF